MIIDGRKIASEIVSRLTEKVKLLSRVPKIVVISTGEDSLRYVAMKERVAEKIGVGFERRVLDRVTTDEFVHAIETLNTDTTVTGVVVQLPLPSTIDTERVLAAIHPLKDPDGLSSRPEVVAPVAAAIAEILEQSHVDVRGKNVVVVGYGRLVGKPVAQWMVDHGAHIFVADISTEDLASRTRTADVVVSGAGVAGLIRSEMVHEGVALVDAGTSEAAGKIVGDIDPACAGKADVFTPVPGGVGPVAVAKLYENLIELASRQME